MGTKYSSVSASGYNASPPSDEGSTAESNKVRWSTIKTKLADVLKTFTEAVNSQLVTTLDTSARAVTASDSAAATDHWRTIQVNTASVTISLADAATMAAGYIVTVANQSSGDITVGLASAANTIDGVTNTTQTISAKEARTYIVNASALGYVTLGDRSVAASDTIDGTIEVAVQSEMESGSSTTLAVTPGRQHFHPSACKAWAKFAGADGTVAASYNITSVTRNGAGNYTVTIATDLSSADYAITAAPGPTLSSGFGAASWAVTAQAAGTFTIKFERADNNAAGDPENVYIACFGDI